MSDSSIELQRSTTEIDHEATTREQDRLALGTKRLHDTYKRAADIQADAQGETAAVIAENSVEEIAVACVLMDMSVDSGVQFGAMPPEIQGHVQMPIAKSRNPHDVREQSDDEERSDSMSPLEVATSNKTKYAAPITPYTSAQAKHPRPHRKQCTHSSRRQRLLKMLGSDDEDEDEASTNIRRRSKRRKTGDDFLRELGLQVKPA